MLSMAYSSFLKLHSWIYKLRQVEIEEVRFPLIGIFKGVSHGHRIGRPHPDLRSYSVLSI